MLAYKIRCSRTAATLNMSHHANTLGNTLFPLLQFLTLSPRLATELQYFRSKKSSGNTRRTSMGVAAPLLYGGLAMRWAQALVTVWCSFFFCSTGYEPRVLRLGGGLCVTAGVRHIIITLRSPPRSTHLPRALAQAW